MKFLEKLIKKTNMLQRTIGLTLNQLDLLTEKIDEHWIQAEKERKSRPDRKRDIGAGHPYKYDSLRDKIIIVFLYYRLYVTQAFLGIVLDIDQANISRLLQKMLPLIEKAADPELSTYLQKIKDEFESNEKVNNWNEFLQKNPHLKDVSTDATEQKCYRPKNNEDQTKYYSGKKKIHGLKTQITVSSEGRILDISKTYPASVHDKKIIDLENTIEKFPIKTCQRFDLGYQGIIKENSLHYIVLPFKKPKGKELPDIAKKCNHAHNKRRIVVENAIAKVKQFKICANIYRGLKESYNQIFRSIAAIINFKLANPTVAM